MLASRRSARLFTVLYFSVNRRYQAHSLTGGNLGFKCTGFSLGKTMKSTLGAADPRRPAHLDDFYEKIRDSEQSSGPQATIPPAIILEQILYL